MTDNTVDTIGGGLGDVKWIRVREYQRFIGATPTELFGKMEKFRRTLNDVGINAEKISFDRDFDTKEWKGTVCWVNLARL